MLTCMQVSSLRTAHVPVRGPELCPAVPGAEARSFLATFLERLLRRWSWAEHRAVEATSVHVTLVKRAPPALCRVAETRANQVSSPCSLGARGSCRKTGFKRVTKTLNENSQTFVLSRGVWGAAHGLEASSWTVTFPQHLVGWAGVPCGDSGRGVAEGQGDVLCSGDGGD